MPISNALLVRTAYGWDEVIRPTSISDHGRREALYGLGANSDPTSVRNIADARLDVVAEPRYQYQAEHTPADDAELAYHGYVTLDSVVLTPPGGDPSDEQVVALAVNEDAVGNATVTASLNDVILYASPLANFVAMLSTAAKKMIPGTGRGDWAEAQPVTPPAIPDPIIIPAGGAWTLTGIATDFVPSGVLDIPYGYAPGAGEVNSGWQVLGFRGGASAPPRLVAYGNVPVGLDHTGSYSGGFRDVGVVQTAPVALSTGSLYIMALFRFGYCDVFANPLIEHPDASFGGFTEIEPSIFGGDPCGTVPAYFASGAGSGAAAPITITFRDFHALFGSFEQEDTSIGVAWMVYEIPGATNYDENLGSETGDGDLTFFNSSDGPTLGFIATGGPHTPAVTAPSGSHVRTV